MPKPTSGVKKLNQRNKNNRSKAGRSPIGDLIPTESIDNFVKVSMLIERCRDRWKAVSVDLYVRDPVTDCLRMAFEPSDKLLFPEAVRTFEYPQTFTRHDSSWSNYVVDAESEQEVRHPAEKHIQKLLENPEKIAFAEFIEREELKSYARLRHPASGASDLVLLVNFKETTDFGSEPHLCGEIEELFQICIERFEPIVEELLRRISSEIRALSRILEPIQRLAALDDDCLEHAHHPTEDSALRAFFKNVLNSALEAFEVQAGEGWGTIHLFDELTGRLSLAAAEGVDVEFDRHVQNAFDGQGLISWVALKRQALIIDDVTSSTFAQIYWPVAEGVRSELAVPMIVEGRCVGVLNIENRRNKFFRTEAARVLAQAANQAAIAFLFRSKVVASYVAADRMRRLLSISHSIAKQQDSATKPIDLLARLVLESMNAERCEIWRRSKNSNDEFTLVGSSAISLADLQTLHPRKEGWSTWIVARQSAVLVTSIASKGKFEAFEWDAAGANWQPIDETQTAPATRPSEVNDNVMEGGYQCELGLPLITGDAESQVIGVIWVKYKSLHHVKFEEIFMREGLGFAGHCALVLDAQLHADLLKRSRYSEQIRRNIHELYFKSQSFGEQMVDGYVISNPLDERIGGDFFVAEEVSDTLAMVLIGDAEGHGVNAALWSLPLYTTFMLTRQINNTAAPQYVLEQLHRIAYTMELRATALCFTILRAGDRCWLTGSSAGHPKLIVRHKREKKTEPFPDTDEQLDPSNPQNSGQLGLADRPLIAVGKCEVHEGDLIVGYTDGVEDAWGDHDQGHNGIEKAILEKEGRDPREIAENIIHAAEAASGGHLQDDATVVVVRVGRRKSKKASD